MRVTGSNAAPPIDPDQSQALKALARHWDGAREGDDKVGRKDLEKIASDAPPEYATPELVAAARYLLDKPAALDALDTAQKGGTPDGKIAVDDLTARLQDVPLTDADRGALSQLATSWNTLREGDQKVGVGDLQKLLGADPPKGTTPDMIEAARYLLDHPELSKYQLDVAQKGGQPDGKISVEDLARLLAREYAGDGALAPAMADVLLAAGSEDDATANGEELQRGLERSGFKVDGGRDALAPLLGAFDADRNEALGAFELREAIASGALVIDGQLIRIQGLTPLQPGHDNAVPDAANDAVIDRPIDRLDATDVTALTVPADTSAPSEPGKTVAIGDDAVTGARAAYAPGGDGRDAPLIVATGASGTRYAVNPTDQPNLFASLTGLDLATGNALGKADGAAALHAVPVGGYTLPDGSRGLAAADPLGERALTDLVTRYRDAGDKATPEQQKFIRALEATQYVSQDTDLGDDFTDPLTADAARGIFDADKVDAALAETFADTSIQADYAALIRSYTPDAAGTAERMFANVTSTGFSDYVTFLQDAGEDAAAQQQIGDALLGLQELDPAKAAQAASQLNVNLLAARISSTDIGDLTEEEAAEAGGDLISSLGLATQGINDITGTLALSGGDFKEVRTRIATTLDSLVGQTAAGRALGSALKGVQAAGGSVLDVRAVASRISDSLPGQLTGKLRGLINDLGDAGLWASTAGAIGATGAVYRMINNGDALASDPWERVTLASELISVVGGASNYINLASGSGTLLGFNDLSERIGLGVDINEAATALKGQYQGSTAQAIADLKTLDLSQAEDQGRIEKTLVDAGVKGDTRAMATSIVDAYDTAVGEVGDERNFRAAIRLYSNYTTSGPGTRENALATALVGVDLGNADDVAAALTSSNYIGSDGEAKAIAAEIADTAAKNPAGTATTHTDVDDILKQHNTALISGAVDVDLQTSLLADDTAAARKLAAGNTIDSIVTGAIGNGDARIAINGKRALGLAVNSLGTVADTTGGVLGLATGINGLVGGLKDGDPNAIASSALGIAGSAAGVTSSVLQIIRGPLSIASKVLGPVGILLDVAGIFVSIFVGGPSESEAFANGFDKYRDDGLLQDDGKQAAERWYLDHLDIEESTVAS